MQKYPGNTHSRRKERATTSAVTKNSGTKGTTRTRTTRRGFYGSALGGCMGQRAPTTPHRIMREPHQPKNITKEAGHDQTSDPDLPRGLTTSSNIATAKTPPHSLSTTIDPSQLITSPDARGVRKLKILTLPINPVYRTHLSMNQRLSHLSIAKNIMPDELQKLRRQLAPSTQHPSHATEAATPAGSSAKSERRIQPRAEESRLV